MNTSIYGDDDVLIDVTAEYSPGRKAPRDRFGAPLAPNDPESMEIVNAVDARGETRILSRGEKADAMDALWRELAEF